MMKFRQPLFRLLVLAPALALLGACSSSGLQGDTVMKRPDYFYLDPNARIESADEMVRFESRYRLYGAISEEEMSAREGHYYSFPWTTTDTASAAALLFEYRQANTGALVHSLRVPLEKVRRKNVAHIEIVGEPFELNGKVTAWRATLWDGDTLVDEQTSFLW